MFREYDLIKSISLDVPMAVELAQRLRKRGVKIPEDVITSEGLVEYVCQYR